MTLICRQRDSNAFEDLYDRYSGMIYGLSLRVVRNTADAGDLMQDIFLYVWKKACLHDAARSSARSWLCLVTKSKALDFLKSRRRKTLREIDSEEFDLASVSAPEVDPSANLSNQELLSHLAEARARLPENQREIIRLAWEEELSQTEIAEKLGCPVGTVKTRMRLGMIALRDSLRGVVS